MIMANGDADEIEVNLKVWRMRSTAKDGYFRAVAQGILPADDMNRPTARIAALKYLPRDLQSCLHPWDWLSITPGS
jgi:hypothetical protein